MHAPPPLQFTLHRYGLWRAACACLVILSFLVMAAWAPSAVFAHPVGLFAAAAIWLTASAGLLAHAFRLAAVSLRWNGQSWRYGPDATRGEEPMAGRLTVAVDLGDWMLLQYTPDGARRSVWLPAQRRGHAHGWHGLRATVYCARPVSQPVATPF